MLVDEVVERLVGDVGAVAEVESMDMGEMEGREVGSGWERSVGRERREVWSETAEEVEERVEREGTRGTRDLVRVGRSDGEGR